MQAEDVRTRTPLQQAGEHPSQAVVQAVMDVDKRHLDTLHEITARGLPSREAIGSDGQSALFLLVQHADMDPAFQEQVLAANARMADKGFRPDEAAMLSDRVALRLGKEQPYGSQLGYEDGHLQPKKPIGRGEEAGVSSLDASFSLHLHDGCAPETSLNLFAQCGGPELAVWAASQRSTRMRAETPESLNPTGAESMR
jgi:hypothetical protein